MISTGSLFVVLLVLGSFVALAAFMAFVEPKRRRRVLRNLRLNGDWTYGRDVSRQSGVPFVYVTLAALEDEGLVERRTDEPREGDGPDRGFLPLTRYRLTEKGRAAAA